MIYVCVSFMLVVCVRFNDTGLPAEHIFGGVFKNHFNSIKNNLLNLKKNAPNFIFIKYLLKSKKALA